MCRSLLGAGLAVALQGANAAAGELPTFELLGFPITRHQLAVVGKTGVQEQAPIPALTFGGMPASAHQIAVLTPHAGTVARAAPTATTVGLAVNQWTQ